MIRLGSPLTPYRALGRLVIRRYKQPVTKRLAKAMIQQLVLSVLLSLSLVLIERGFRGVPGETA